ncbi:hypothetical protein RUM43_007679 [Polyplax serrata]|uniref:Beta-sarcoglycan n=1 Tax=Polyplax serrata TaxID=468196 RepID=A0AAN8SA82_POLSC
MSVFKNSLYSSSTDLSSGPAGGSLANSESNSYNRRIEKTYRNNNNNYNNVNTVRQDDIYAQKQRNQQEHSTYLFWTLVVLLFILAFGNLILTFVILSVLRLGQGMESLELVPEESLIKFFGNTDLDNVYKRDGKLESFHDTPMEIVGDEGDVEIGILETERELTPLINFGPKAEMVKNVESFDVRHPSSGKKLFSTDFPNFGLPRGVEKLDVQIVLTKRISSAVDENLLLKSDSFIKMKGSEGIHIDGKEIVWSADQDIFLKSVNKSIIINGADGVFIDIRNMPLTSNQNYVRSFTQYKICVCMPEGKLFRLSVPPGQKSPVSCSSVEQSVHHNPCL